MAVHLAKGTRDFLPPQMRHRLAVMDKVRAVFERYGFEPLGTPAFEREETLTGKYGDEGEKLIYRILKRGEGGRDGDTDLALRYDLTVPLARVVAMNQDLRLPFKRWQMAPVWRADRPQRGRFREFYQCDADIVGTTSPLADAECLAVCSDSLTALGFTNYVIHLNDRRILRSMARMAGAHVRETTVLTVVDKLDKIGADAVSAELREAGLDDAGLERLWSILNIPSGHHDTLDKLAEHLDEEGRVGVTVLHEVLDLALAMGVPAERLVVDPTLARGLDYYTGPVFETVVTEPKIGSVSGGGRYDGLIGMFSGQPIPAVGVSLGLERLITVMEELGMVGANTTTADVLVTIHAPEQRAYALKIAATLRLGGIRTELFLEDKKLKAQLKYANARGFRWVAFAGPDEEAAGAVTLKDFVGGVQRTVSLQDAASSIDL